MAFATLSPWFMVTIVRAGAGAVAGIATIGTASAVLAGVGTGEAAGPDACVRFGPIWYCDY